MGIKRREFIKTTDIVEGTKGSPNFTIFFNRSIDILCLRCFRVTGNKNININVEDKTFAKNIPLTP